MPRVYAALAEEEGRMISVRTRSALEPAKAPGVQLGNPGLEDARRARRQARYDWFDANEPAIMSAIRDAMARGAKSLDALAEALNARMPCFQGRAWYRSTVQSFLCRAGTFNEAHKGRDVVWRIVAPKGGFRWPLD